MSQFIDPPGFSDWEATVPDVFRRDPIWRTPAYRFGLWLSELAKADANTSTRESIDWYFKARDTLGVAVVEQRVLVLDRIIRILTVIIPRERLRGMRRRRRPTNDPDGKSADQGDAGGS